MKQLFSLNFLTVFIIVSVSSSGQNTFDNYGDLSTATPTYFDLYPTSNYTGEYQIHLRTDIVNDPYYSNWPAYANVDLGTPTKNLSVSYKIETVSFPFSPKHTTPSQRILRALDNSVYSASTNQWDGRIYRVYQGVHEDIGGTPTNCVAVNRKSTLISLEYKDGPGSTSVTRTIYPHTILKHTIYLHCDATASTPPVDSLVFVIDHTRGKMRKYPFLDSNYVFGNFAPAYDILVSATNFYGSEPGNGFDSWNPNNPQSTVNYVAPIPNDGRSCDNIDLPMVRPSPYSLTSFQLLNNVGTLPAGYSTGAIENGIQHQYLIDQPIDLTIINPAEKIIYNPSEVELNLATADNPTGIYTQIFPSGYTFKTVSGRYPSDLEVYAADPAGLYSHKNQVPVPTTLNFDDVGPNDGIFSYYYIRSGTTLKIESCVSIYDTKIIVDPGATLIYDASKTYGNFIIENNGTVNNHSSTTTASCGEDCYKFENYDDFWLNPTVTSDQTWTGAFSPFDFNGDGIIRIAGQLHISAGKTLTITDGLRFEFGETAGIYVERGAKLIVNADPSNPCVFTSAEFCKKGMWKGMEVWGDRTKVQTDPSQGLISLNNAKISNARDGIITSGPSWGYEGGVVQCQNVEFKNNRRSVGFSSYQSGANNLSSFSSCTFLTTDYLNDPTYLTSDGRRHAGGGQVTMWDVKHVKFTNCHFENKAKKADGITPLYDTDTRSMGIFAIDADVSLRKTPGSSLVTNFFTGYSDAVWCINTNNTAVQDIEGAKFQNNVRSITIEGGRYSLIEDNIIEVPLHQDNFSISGKLVEGYNKPTGVYMIGAKDFTIYNNIITNYGGPALPSTALTEYNYGIVVNNCSGSTGPISKDGDGTGYVYKNTISNLNIALQSELDNRGAQGSGYGLQYSCNSFANRINGDVAVVSKDFSNPALLREQGSCAAFETQTGNTYFSSCTGDQKLEFDATAVFYDTYPTSISPFIYRDQNTPSYIVDCSNMPFISCNGALGPNPNPCDDIAWFCGDPCLTQSYISSQAAAKNAKDIYTSLLDGGNTTYLLSAINSNMSAGSLKNLLLSKSPYLSDQVLIATLNRQDLPPYGHLQQIFIANSPITAPVMTELQNTGLPSGILNSILAAQTGISPRREKESAIDYYNLKVNLAKIILIQQYLKNDDLESIEQLTATDLTVDGLKRYAEILIRKGELITAQNTITKINALESPHISDRTKILNITMDLVTAKKNWLDLTPNQISIVEQIYTDNIEQATNARAILAFSKGLQYARYPYDFEPTRMQSALPETTNENSNMDLVIYPNPAIESAMVEINLGGKEIGELVVYNLLGSEIYRQFIHSKEKLTIDLQNYTNGIYLFTVKTDGSIQKKQKVIISK